MSTDETWTCTNPECHWRGHKPLVEEHGTDSGAVETEEWCPKCEAVVEKDKVRK